MSENNGRPKVELSLNQESRLKMLRDKAFTGRNSYGNYYLYSVSEDGIEKSFFATEEIHKQMLESGIRAGDQFLIRKKAVQQGKKVMAQLEFEVISKQAPPPSNGNDHSDDFKTLMKTCVADAVEITKDVNSIPWQNEDIRSIALTMFIQRARLN